MTAIRPDSFAAFHGQAHAVEVLKIAVLSAKRRKAVLGHTLLTGPPGLGKTTLAASVLPKELGVEARSLVCSAIEKPTDFTPTVSTMKEGEILFLDELHALPKLCFEQLYSVMEDSKLTVVLGDDKNKQVLSLDLPHFTIIGATTREGLLPDPLRDRFKHHARLDLYQPDEMLQVLEWTAEKLGAKLSGNPLSTLISVCHGTARHAGRLLEACLDTSYADDSKEPGVLTRAVIRATLKRLGYSLTSGLNKPEQQLLQRLAEAKGPVGLNTLSAVIDEETSTIETVYEPWLLRQGYIAKTPSGRVITPVGRKVLEADDATH